MDTRSRLLETAERLFAERGINGVSLREIGAAAGQRNTGAVRYHFGSKSALLDAVFEHRMTGINEHREAMLAAFDADGRGADIRALAEAFVLPLSDMLGEPGRPTWYLRFAVQAGWVQGTAPMDLAREPWTHGVHLVQQRFDAALAALRIPAAVRRDRWTLFTSLVAHALADRELVVEHGPWDRLSPRDDFLANLLDAAVALATAPVTTRTARRRPA